MFEHGAGRRSERSDIGRSLRLVLAAVTLAPGLVVGAATSAGASAGSAGPATGRGPS